MSHVLLLNADGQPVNYIPLSTIDWKEAVTYMWLDKVSVLEWYDDWVVHSANWETRVPAVVMLKNMLKRRSNPRFSKHNIFIRDLFTCQYCSTQFPRNELTLDHVLPISKGGRTSWDNIVAACNPCNSRKGNSLTPLPKTAPHRPDYWELVNKRKQLEIVVKHPSWLEFI
jgi:5-methylcytosine-specific restriction endonuclease McrA